MVRAMPAPGEMERAELVSVDVFDTLLRRRPVGERERLLRAAQAAVRDPLLAPLRLDARVVWRARLMVQRIAYRVTEIDDARKDVRLDAMLERLCTVLGLPAAAAQVFAAAEIEQDLQCVLPDAALVARLAGLRRNGVRVVALSDTAYSEAQLRTLLGGHGCLEVLDAVYTSADLGVTKRGGAAFAALAQRERVAPQAMVHLGDDAEADGRAARAQGVRGMVAPKPRWRRAAHRLRTAWFALQRPPRAPAPLQASALFGPIVAEHCLALWTYLDSIAAPDDAVALFCARGGLRIRHAYDTLVERLELPRRVAVQHLMVSRLVAARGAFLNASERADEEMAREFQGDTCDTVARALIGQPVTLGERWRRPYTPQLLKTLLNEEPALLAPIWRQQRLFERHLEQVAGRARRIVLCDTGLYGSTQRLLEHAMPERRFESALFARCNYKGFDDTHFARTTGLMVERDCYSPFDQRSSVLRYWHLVEDLFEPDLESVRLFDEDHRGRVLANLERPHWADAIDGEPDSAYAATMDYLRGLGPGDAARVHRDAGQAWAALARAIRFPSAPDVQRLAVGARSVDFGRTETVPAAQRLSLGDLRAALWKEGLIARHSGLLRWPALALLEMAHVARDLLVRAR